MARPTILFRRGTLGPNEEQKELEACARAHLPIIGRRSEARAGDLVVARYSAVPFYDELLDDLQAAGAGLVNSRPQHDFASSIAHWYPILREFTPTTWFSLEEMEDVPVVLKGVVNSRKHQWDGFMFAQDRRQAADVYMRLSTDGLIGTQPICIRRYVPLETYGTAIAGLPITCEWRFFVLAGEVIGSGYYWHNFVGDLPIPIDVATKEPPDARRLVEHVAKLVHERRHSIFYTVDVARRTDGTWIVIELNDGQMAGLEGIDPFSFYERLHTSLRSYFS